MSRPIYAVWRGGDPRLASEHKDNKRVSVVVSNGKRATVAHCEMNHGWMISLDEMMDGITAILDEPWPESWMWTELPSVAT